MSFVFLFILAGVIVGVFLTKNVSVPAAKKHLDKQSVNMISPYDIWWKNLDHTPLSHQESIQIAQRAAELYMQWKNDIHMDHSWLCLGIEANKISFKQVSSYNGGFNPIPTVTISYSHKISCQDDRVMLASYILTAIKSKDSACALFLDGDSLILPTNSK